MLTSPLVIAVVLNWNKARATVGCIASLARQEYDNLRIVVVDNGSEESSVSILQQSPEAFQLLRNGRNLGFSGGVNVGITHAMEQGAAYIWLVNNDAQPERDVLPTMLRVIQQNRSVGLASPMIRNGDADDEIEFCGGLWTAGVFETTNDVETYRRWGRTLPDNIWLVGTALLIKREVVQTIGLFDERFFAYWEDNDYSVRSLRAGYLNIVVPEAVVRHWSGTPTSDPASKPPHYFYYMARNEILFHRKYAAPIYLARSLWWAVNRQFDRIRTLHAPAAVDAVLSGLWDGLRGRGGAFEPDRSLPAIPRCVLTYAMRMSRHQH